MQISLFLEICIYVLRHCLRRYSKNVFEYLQICKLGRGKSVLTTPGRVSSVPIRSDKATMVSRKNVKTICFAVYLMSLRKHQIGQTNLLDSYLGTSRASSSNLASTGRSSATDGEHSAKNVSVACTKKLL